MTKKKENTTPEELIRKKLSGKYDRFSFVLNFDFATSSKYGSAPKSVFEVKHPFVNNIDEFYPYSPEGIAFSEFVDDGMNSSQSAKELYP